jgi:DNA-binding transcriptional ArsR family regulator
MFMRSTMAGESLVFKVKADLLKSLAHPSRLAILEYLKGKEASVGEMVANIGLEQSCLSKHLSVLRQSGILSSRQEKVTVYYSVRDKDIFLVLRTISGILMKKFREGEDLLAHLSKAKP